MNKLLTPLIACTLASPIAFAAEKHVHGEAELFVAIEGKQVLIELVSPADNLLGFEHKPKTQAQKERVEKTLKQLQQANQIASVMGGNCKQSDAFVESPFAHGDEHKHDHHDDHKDHKKDHHDHHDDHKSHGHGEHKEDKHAHHDDKHGHKEHSSEHKGHAHDEDTHSEFHATYTLSCEDTNAVTGIKATAFDHFGGFEEIDLKWVKGDKQGGAELTKTKTSAEFK